VTTASESSSTEQVHHHHHYIPDMHKIDDQRTLHMAREDAKQTNQSNFVHYHGHKMSCVDECLEVFPDGELKYVLDPKKAKKASSGEG
jgi:hypothetical protein